MVYRDYTKEIGAEPREKIVPWPIALMILAVLTLGVVWFVSTQLKTSAVGIASSSLSPGP